MRPLRSSERGFVIGVPISVLLWVGIITTIAHLWK